MISLRIGRILFAAKQSRTTMHISRLLFVGSYLHVTWFALSHFQRMIIVFSCFEVIILLRCVNHISKSGALLNLYFNFPLPSCPPSLCFKRRLSAKADNHFHFLTMQMNLNCIGKVLQLGESWRRGCTKHARTVCSSS